MSGLTLEQKRNRVKNWKRKHWQNLERVISLVLSSTKHKFLDCERLLLPGVTLHLRFYRCPNNALEKVVNWSASEIETVDQTSYSVMIEKASLFVNKVVHPDFVTVSIERALTKSPAVYPYTASLNKSLHIQAGQYCW